MKIMVQIMAIKVQIVAIQNADNGNQGVENGLQALVPVRSEETEVPFIDWLALMALNFER